MLNLGDKLAAAGVVSQSAVDRSKKKREEDHWRALEAEEAAFEYLNLLDCFRLNVPIRDEIKGFVSKYGAEAIPIAAMRALRKAVDAEKQNRNVEATGRREWAKFLSAARDGGKQWP